MKEAKINIAVLEAYGEDFTKLLGVKCKLHQTGDNLYCIAKCLDGGALDPVTHMYDANTLHMVCMDILNNARSVILRCAKVAETQERGTHYDWVSGSLFANLTKSIAVRISSLLS